MADILIFGMKMPTDEPLRIVLNPNGQLFVDHGVTFTEYEAIELPEHGDLIDRDKLVESKYVNNVGILVKIAEAPVIVPSNKEITDGD